MCEKVDVSFKWFDMLEYLPELCILNPQGLFSGDECLTYNGEGKLIMYTIIGQWVFKNARVKS